MKLESKSNTLLAITKSKAKLYEFGVEEQYHIELPISPSNLLITTIGIIGELCASEARLSDDTADNIEELKNQLVTVGQYFDALNQSRTASGIQNYLLLLGSTAYYLGGMPGSSHVLSKGLEYNIVNITPSYIEGILIWLLKSDIKHVWYRHTNAYLADEADAFVRAYVSFFEREGTQDEFKHACQKLRSVVYQSGSDRELILVDATIAVALNKIRNSCLICLENYSGLSLESWTDALEKEGFIKEFWPAQHLIGESGVLKGVSAVIQMPTSAGKTKSTELIIRSAFVSGRADTAFVIAPFRALCREITSNFKGAFEGEDISVNELQDTTELNSEEQEFLNFLLGVSHAKSVKNIVITTPEKLVYTLRHEPSLAKKIGLLVFDEGHQFDTGKRGVTYELLLTHLKTTVTENTQKVLISAVMANAETIGDWLNGGEGVHIQGSSCLPTLKSVAFVSWTAKLGQLHYLNPDNKGDSGYFVPRMIKELPLKNTPRETKIRVFPERAKTSSVSAYLGLRLCHQGPVALFCGTRKTVNSICEILIDAYKRELQLSFPKDSSDEVELGKIAFLASLHFGEDAVFSRAIKLGILPHSSNIPNGIRVSVEWAMEKGRACLVVCTSTLAQGVNLPIKYLVVSSLNQGAQDITTRDFQNLIGRAGRSGHHTEGSIIFADSKIYDKRLNFKENWRWHRAIHLLSFTNAESCLSSLKGLIAKFDFDYTSLKDTFQFIETPVEHRNSWIDWSKKNGIDIISLLDEMSRKLDLINSVESFFLSYLKENPETADRKTLVSLIEDTLAFHLASDDEQAALIEAFRLISDRVFSVPKEKHSYYGRTLLGVGQLVVIERWIDENLFDLELCTSSQDILNACWPLIVNLCDKKLFNSLTPQNLLPSFAQSWIEGKKFVDIFKEMKKAGLKYQAPILKMSLTMDHIVEFTTGILAYDAMLFVGAIADILEGRQLDQDAATYTRLLQNQLKLGLNSELEIWLHRKGYVDREVCKTLASVLLKKQKYETVFEFSILEDNFELVQETLVKYPTYFLEAYKPRQLT